MTGQDSPPDDDAGGPVEEAMRRIEDAFADDAQPRRREPSRDELRAAEALLFASGESMSAADLATRLNAQFDDPVDVGAILMRLKRDYADRGVLLAEVGGRWRFQTAPDLAGLFSETREAPKKLPKAAMETLAVIAYHQPVTRAEIEEIRGVSLSRTALDLLLEMGWIKPRGRRRSPGRPMTIGTTDAFLAHFGLSSLDALPGKDDLKGLGLLDPRAASQLEIPRPGDAQAGGQGDEEPLSPEDDAAGFFVDHLDEER